MAIFEASVDLEVMSVCKCSFYVLKKVHDVLKKAFFLELQPGVPVGRVNSAGYTGVPTKANEATNFYRPPLGAVKSCRHLPVCNKSA